MNPEQQRIAIAEACGWTDIKPHSWHPWEVKLWGRRKGIRNMIPDYLNDLNAMHEAETFIRNAQDQMRYASEILIAMGFDDLMEASDLNVDYCWHVMGATAAQRAEAFLRTLNIWKQ